VMDGINQIREILGFVFYIDTGGAIVWRPPNIWKNGNFVSGVGYVGEDSVRTVSEQNVLMDYGVQINDKNLRSEIIVVSADDSSVYGSFAPGFAVGEVAPSATDTSDIALLGGQERVMLVPNYPFGTSESENAFKEVEKFAYLTSLWIHWSYRTSRFKIPGNPAFEPDDQIRIFERTTSEAYVHYILGLNSRMDIRAGTWTMDVDTHWLGSGPSEQWVIDYNTMTPALYEYLKAIGQIPDGAGGPPFDEGWATPPDIDLDDPVTRENYLDLFPELVVPIVSPPHIDFETGDLPPYVDVPDATGGGGTGYGCGNSLMMQRWGTPNGANRVRKRIMQKWDAEWDITPALRPRFTHPNQTIDQYCEFRSDIWPAVKLLMDVCVEEEWNLVRATGYVVRKVKLVGGGYGTSWSNHAWGVAIDLNSNELPHGRRAPAGHIVFDVANKALKMRTGNGKQVWFWGNYFSNAADPMHFQLCVSPSDLKSGVFRN